MKDCRHLEERRTATEKLSRLPTNVKVHKRPLLHEPIASPYAGKQSVKVIYVGSKTPFMSAFKRVKQLLHRIEERRTQSNLVQQRKIRTRGLPVYPSSHVEEPEPILVKATGKAIDKALQLALLLQQQTDLTIKLQTGSVDAIDDLVEGTIRDQDLETRGEDRDPETMVIDDARSSKTPITVTTDGAHGDVEQTAHEMPEARNRYTSMIIVEVALR